MFQVLAFESSIRIKFWFWHRIHRLGFQISLYFFPNSIFCPSQIRLHWKNAIWDLNVPWESHCSRRASNLHCFSFAVRFTWDLNKNRTNQSINSPKISKKSINNTSNEEQQQHRLSSYPLLLSEVARNGGGSWSHGVVTHRSICLLFVSLIWNPRKQLAREEESERTKQIWDNQRFWFSFYSSSLCGFVWLKLHSGVSQTTWFCPNPFGQTSFKVGYKPSDLL